jgi:hypothetical protein
MSNRLEELLQKSSKKPSKKRLEEIKNGIAKLSVSMLGSAEVDNYLIQELEC